MKKLDRLGWAADISFRAFGLKIGVRVSSAAVLDSLFEYLPFGWKLQNISKVDRLYSVIAGRETAHAGIKHFSLLYSDIRQIGRSLQLHEIFEIMKSDMEFYLAEHSPNRLFVHAGAVSWKGRAIVIPGPTMSGKSTLVNALLDAGASYFSDEFAVFDGMGRAYPFARPLTLRGRGKQIVSNGSPTGPPTPTNRRPVPVGLVILTRYRPGAYWKPKTLTRAQGVLGLLAHTPAARRLPRKALKTLGEVVTPAGVFTSVRGEAAPTATQILRLLD